MRVNNIGNAHNPGRNSVDLARAQDAVSKYDIDKNGGLDRAEIALASLYTREQGDENTHKLFANFIQGGDDREGLFPDLNGDQLISKGELETLAGKKGDKNFIESADLQAQFPKNFMPNDDTKYPLYDLHQIARGTQDKLGLPDVFGNLYKNDRGLLKFILQLWAPVDDETKVHPEPDRDAGNTAGSQPNG